MYKLKQVFTSANFYFSFVVVLLATIANFVGGELIKVFYPNRTTINDFLYDRFPLIGWTQYLTDIFVLIAAALILIYFFKYQFKYLPYLLMAFGIFYFFRSFMILLNPFGGYYGNESTYGISTIKQYGAFPSGHTGFAVVCYLMSDKLKSKPIHYMLWFLVVGEIVALLLSRGHYGVDIAGGLLLGYYVACQMKKYREKLTL
jgi:membrane-associated phospholipid phosphatase